MGRGTTHLKHHCQELKPDQKNIAGIFLEHKKKRWQEMPPFKLFYLSPNHYHRTGKNDLKSGFVPQLKCTLF